MKSSAMNFSGRDSLNISHFLELVLTENNTNLTSVFIEET